MNRIYSLFRNWSLATRQFLVLFIVTFAMLGILAYINYHKAAVLFKSQMLDDAWQLIVRTNDFIDSYLDNGQNILLLMSGRIDLLNAGGREAEDYLRFIAENNSTIVKNLYIISTDGRVYSNNQLTYDIVGNPELPKLYELSQQNYGASVVSQPYVSPLSGRTAAISRPMTNKQGTILGIAVIELDLEKLNRKMSELTGNEYQSFVILSDKGSVVTFDMDSDMLPHKPKTYLPELPDDFAAELHKLSNGTSLKQGTNGTLTTIKSGMNRLGWSLIVMIRERYFYQNTMKLYDNYKSAVVLWAVVLLIVTFLMSRYFTHPIRMLAAKMDRVRDMTVIPNIGITRSDEIGRLASSYNAMMERIRNLLVETTQLERRKKELELKVLQSQIAPHFLYNTLACISSLAKQNKSDEVRNTIRALVGVLSLSFDKTSEFVTVAEEMEGLWMYMQIQKTRYGSKFDYTTEIPPEMLQHPILKLTLQPIVENAVFHGIIPGKERGQIAIRAAVHRGMLCIYISDDGIGMDPDTLNKVLSERIRKVSKERFTGIGLHNVHDRLRLHYGEPYGIRIRSLKHIGTVVRIRIPA